MERQVGLGRSLEDVLDSLTPVEPDPAAPGRVLFEPEDVEQQLDQLMGDIAALRERVQHLVGLVPDDVVLRVASDSACAESTTKHTKKTKKNKKQKKKAEGTKEHRGARRGA
jgi:regulator of replication initiation timing